MNFNEIVSECEILKKYKKNYKSGCVYKKRNDKKLEILCEIVAILLKMMCLMNLWIKLFGYKTFATVSSSELWITKNIII